VRHAIRAEHLLTIADTMRLLDWRTPNGCATCRPALNYYLISTWPREAVDDPQSRFINERAHANIQKDGTFSVVPRMWGGETSASELRRIADVVDKYRIPTVKVTGGQRIDLLGVKKQDLPSVWRDLDMPSGHAYAKALRTVKTCVGSEWCRFGTQDSTTMGKRLERALWRMYAPHKVKLAVSGCPRNCAESGIKDVGVIGVDSGWEIYVAGNGGIKTEVAQFLVKVKTPRKCSNTRRVPAALSRGGLVSRAHRPLRRARRARLRQAARARRCAKVACTVGTVAVRARWRARPLARDAARTDRHATVRSVGGVVTPLDAVVIVTERAEADVVSDADSSRSAQSTIFRCSERASSSGPGIPTATSRVPQRRRSRIRRARPLPAQGRAAVAGNRLRRSRCVSAAQLVDRARDRRRGRARRRMHADVSGADRARRRFVALR
jgi:hypothetical protein